MSVALEHTLMFVLGELGDRSRILEVGAGDGRLALALAGRGRRVTAIDISLEHLIDEARAHENLTIREEDICDHRGGPYDAVVFTRSLHHIPALDRALGRAREVLAKSGLLALEEFDVAAPDAATAAWYFADGEGALARWREEHDEDPPLHDAAEMRRAVLAAGFDVSREERVPYLYRALSKRPGRGDAGDLFAEEEAAIAAANIVAVGYRLIAETV